MPRSTIAFLLMKKECFMERHTAPARQKETLSGDHGTAGAIRQSMSELQEYLAMTQKRKKFYDLGKACEGRVKGKGMIRFWG